MVARRIAIRVVALILGIAIGLGIGEVSVRILKPQRTGPLQLQADARFFAIPIPNLKGQETLPGVYTWSFTHDSTGRRVTGLSDRRKAAARVLLLGDSFTYGQGVNDEQTFASVLEQRLSQGESPIAVVNAGNPAQGTDYALRFFESVGRDLKPDVTVLGFYANDFRDNERTSTALYRVSADGTLTERRFRARTDRVSLRGSLYRWIVARSHLANLGRTVILRVREGGGPSGFPRDVYEGYVTEKNKGLTQIFLHRLVKVVREAQSDLLIVYFPTADEVKLYRETGRIPRNETTLRDSLTPVSHGLISLLPVLAGSPEALEKLYFDEQNVGRPSGHWTAMGHTIVANLIEDVVRTRLEQRKSAGQSNSKTP